MDQSVCSGRGHVSVLSCFPPSVGRDVAVAVVKPLRAGLRNPDTRSLLHTDSQVKWTMEVLCYGLTLPLDGDTVQLCVDVYTDWLMALVSPRDSFPPPISREPNLYTQKILRHLGGLFLSRSEQASPVYLSLCQQVLLAVQLLARESAVMSGDTWETLLHFLLRINHNMLAPPTTTDVLEQLSHLSMAVLFEVWLLSCSRCFPSHSLWQTARQMLSSWRHQPAVVEQWSRVMVALTSRLLVLSFGPSFPHLKVPDEDASLIPADMDDQRVPQTWFRFLHLLSNLVDLSRPVAAGSTPSLPEEAMRGGGRLPNIFFRAMKGVGTMVDAFLGVTVVNKESTEQQLPSTGVTPRIHFRDRLPSLGVAVARSPFKDRLPPYGISRPRSGSAPPIPVNILSVPSNPPSTTSTLHNTRLKPVNVSKATSKPPTTSSSPHHWKSSTHPPPSSHRPPPSPLRCNVDSLLHLFGGWLFDAALIHRDSAGDVTVMSERWAAGRAEACGMLCRIFSCKKTAEDILSVYLSRFYLVLLRGVQVSEEACPPVLASILMNSTCLFCCDLRGVNLLFPCFLFAVESVLLDRELLRFKSFVRPVDLRRASILVLLSLLPLPLQLGSVQSEVLLDGKFSGDDVTAGNFLSLKPRLRSILIGALQTETDTTNTQILLAAMLNLIQDSALFEAAGQTQQQTESWQDGASRPISTGETSGTSGTSGTRGPSGHSGTRGQSGLSGPSGTSGTRGPSGHSGTRGQSGLSGPSGTSGTRGHSGHSVTRGPIGPSGTRGHSGPSGTRGTSGASGTSGTSGTGIRSAEILWVQLVRLLTQRLMAQWRNDSAVCLSALEVLGGLAKVEVSVEESESRRALSSVCSYIVFLCSRPPPLHSRDLHSIIVAAFYCLNVWLTQHPAVLDHQECLLEVLEIVELGISGSKSGKEQEVRCKEEKELNPSSLRVKEAAEATLNCVMQVSGAFPLLGDQLDEDALIGCSTLSDASVKKFRYFVVGSSVILAMLERPPGPGEPREPREPGEPGPEPGEAAKCPSLTVLIRGASGRHSWTLQHQLQPRDGRTATQQTPIPEQRRVAQEDSGIRCGVKHQLFPANMDRVSLVKADLSIPLLDDIVTDKVQQQLQRLQAALKTQRLVEAQPQVSGRSVVMTICRPPPPISSFQTARLFLSHLGLLTPETLKSSGSVPPQLLSLDSSLPGFSDDLKRLDELQSRNCDSASIFYMRAGQRTAAEILRNVESSCSVPSYFLDFLSSLGWPVEAGQRQRGGVSINSSEFPAVLGDSGGGVFDGERFVLMYADALTEITFIVPSSSHTDWSKSPEEAEPLTSQQCNTELSQDSAPPPTRSPVEDMKSFRDSESKLLIVWVERFEDIESFPQTELLSETQTHASASNVQLIFIHPLKTGLYRICFRGNGTSKFSLVVPLVNGSVVSKRSLGFLVRETVINCCHRRRLESDSTLPSHVRRKQMINDIILRYHSRCSEPAFYTALFQDP
ncbi:ral GTPase-activating protein subunit beta isoform X2 [Perca fluviatilis]|uniref:ral GTPase-activating protein subunit beta isoform X2 n=1 Tax=Perca fluviatilis TaxID=8168 RepID=UPI0019662B48|nr:ral GTPase-activating protein subunit beta isoform X2 [Perca fluviatilis]